MENTMTPSTTSTTTSKQITKAVDQYRAMLQKHQSEWPSDAFQIAILGSSDYIGDQLGMIRKYVEMVNNMVSLSVCPDRSLTPEQVLSNTRRKQYVDNDVVKTMTRGNVPNHVEISVVFFKLGRYITDNDLEREYALRGLKPADSYSLAKVNENDPAFADTHPNGTHWKDANGDWCCATFFRWHDERRVYVYRDGHGWDDYWWFAGVRK